MIRLSDRQLEKLSDIFSDIGLVSLASVILPAILGTFDKSVLLLGILVTLVCWIISLVFRR